MPPLRLPHRRAGPRAAACAVLVLGVSLAHVLLWQALHPPAAAPTPHETQRSPRPSARPSAAAPVLQLLDPPRTAVAAAAPVATSGIVPPAPVASVEPARPRAQTPAAPSPAPQAAAAPAAAVAVPQPTAGAADAAALRGGAAELPVYATRLPEPARLHYRLQRGASLGTGTLLWQRSDAGYALRLDLQWDGQPAQGSASHGQIDADGVAPLRHAELRRMREQRAVNFQRDAATITFSGPQAAYALPPGAQDRLSWMIQLPAVVEADAAFARPGAVVTLFVAGTRGDAEAWRFEVQRREALALPSGAVAQALLLRREPTRPYDTRVEVWLDPARQHLPVRAVFTTLPGGQPLQLELAALDRGLENDPAAPR